MGKITQITFTQLIQVRQYEPCTISATATVNDNEDATAVIEKTKEFVQDELKKVYIKANAPKEVVQTKSNL